MSQQSAPVKIVNKNIPIKKTSIAWLYFIETNLPGKLKCIKCNRLCSFKRKSTGNLMRHMRLRHPDLYASHYSQGLISQSHSQDTSQLHTQSIIQDETCNAINEIKKDGDENSEDEGVETEYRNTAENAKSSSDVPEQNLQAVAYYLVQQTDANQSIETDSQILKLIVKEFYSFKLIENQEFVSFVNMLNSNYILPNYKFSSGELFLKTYQCKVQELKSALKEMKYIALTIDKWTSVDDENFIAVTAHYLNKDLTQKSAFLDCISFHEDSSVSVPIFLQELVGNWRISDKIVAVVSENNPAIVEAIKECQWQHISCFAHTLNKIIVRCLANINVVLAKVRNIVDYFKRIPDAMAELQAFQNKLGITNAQLKKDTPSRWNSTFDMMTRFIKNKCILKSRLVKDISEELSLNDWLIIEHAVKLLVVFNTITVEICSEKDVSLSKVPYMIRFMVKHVTNIIENIPLPSAIKSMGKKLKEELLRQSKIIEENDIICQSVLLDPRLKRRGFPDNSFNTAYSSLLKSVISLKNEKMQEIWRKQSGKQESTEQEFFLDVWNEFRQSEIVPVKDFTPDATVEIEAFLSEAYISMKENPMTYWGNETNQSKFPVLFELVKSKLCVPASSIPCKNIFSKAGNALLERRNLLPSKYLKETLFLHHNL